MNKTQQVLRFTAEETGHLIRRAEAGMDQDTEAGKEDGRFAERTSAFTKHSLRQPRADRKQSRDFRQYDDWKKKRAAKDFQQNVRSMGNRGRLSRPVRKTVRPFSGRAGGKAGWILAGTAVLLAVVLLFTVATGMLFVQGLGSGIAVSTYPSSDEDMLAAEEAYTALEQELQQYLDTYEQTHSYDEYHYSLDAIRHDPYVLISTLTALHGQWTMADVRETLQTLFDRQYLLTETVRVEYRGEEPWYICTVTLVNVDLSHLPANIMTQEQLKMYSIYMRTLGNRPDLFPESEYVARYYGKDQEYEIPPEALSDKTFAAMMAEATKYLGYPYVWGGSSPATSFDCSGYVCWVLNHSGWNVGRITAESLYQRCIRVSPSEAKPGDLIFFTKTYKTSRTVTHVGIYMGENQMIHCGDPIKISRIDTTYWKSHFYAFGRLT